ncbi:hypothetical protein [Carboxylicivirga caseinilyticus]|uniref:hypothetical protein n=1 Tax=Carboxylicivirga caseinilyticus TaxID=3417572 RepID=UPI003D3539C5|nr:hypothetical protein [Marinilabiliaceae bacterium A049]
MTACKKLTIIQEEVRLKEFLKSSNVTKQSIMNAFDTAEEQVLEQLLMQLLNRKPSKEDYEMLSFEEYKNEDETGKFIFFCEVKIGKLLMGGTMDYLECLLSGEGIIVSFYPVEIDE